ncbi:ABC transporter ATP-binding protein [Tessaracoccus caeni]|uniref:ABC transporter ATP-binding protein n=1 Tax=Tessaracoccus caeni TaxID=3031239 RepID=UPI0023DACD4C|nr:ABC transporter ATP-binding protein [Tessaracoccus caeni]MDF1488163.1 ABC transporter ATP-binding protein [Tessaracoccus caeni]
MREIDRTHALAPAKAGKPNVLRFLPYVKPYWRQFTFSFLTAPAGVGLSVLGPVLLGRVVDGPIRDGDARGVVWYAFLLLLVGVVEALLGFLRRWIMVRATSHMEADIRLDLFDQLQRLPLQFHKSWESGQLLSRMMSDLGVLRRFMSFGLVVLLMNSIHIVVVVGIMVATLWQVGVAVMVLVIPVIVATFVLMGRFGKISRRVQDQTGDVASSAEESLHGVRVVRSFGRAKYVFEGFESRAAALAASGIDRMNLASVMWTLLEVFPSVLLAVVLLGVGIGVSGGVLSVGAAVTFVTLLLSLAWPVGSLGFLLSFMREAATAADRVAEVFDAPVTIVSGDQRLENPRGELRLSHVEYQFHDADHPTLRDVDLTIAPGETVALVGGTGSGKSTLVSLIPRLDDVTGGQILLDGIDLRDLDLTQLRSLIGVAFEDPILFSMSARENLTLGRPDATDDDIAEAVRVARAEFVYDLPWGLDTRLGEQGLSLSGGQRQRLALARAILVSPKVLVLDDTLSALDIHTEAEVEEALKSTLVGVTGLVVAHRASTVLLADRVAMLVEGRIAHVGTHSELLATVPEYRELLSADYSIALDGGDNGGRVISPTDRKDGDSPLAQLLEELPTTGRREGPRDRYEADKR